MNDFDWSQLPSIHDTDGKDIAPDDLLGLIDFCLNWRTRYDVQREQGEDMAASTTKARRARSIKLLAHAAGARGLDEVAILRLIEDHDAPTDELLRLRGVAWREYKARPAEAWSRTFNSQTDVARALAGKRGVRWRSYEKMFPEGYIKPLEGNKVQVRIDHLPTTEQKRLA